MQEILIACSAGLMWLSNDVQLVSKYFLINKTIRKTMVTMAGDVVGASEHSRRKQRAAIFTTKVFIGITAWYVVATVVFLVGVIWASVLPSSFQQAVAFFFLLDSCFNPILCTCQACAMHELHFALRLSPVIMSVRVRV